MTKPRIRTPEERRLSGRALRNKTSRASHGEVVLGQGDKRDIIALIEDSNEDRVQDLVAIRHGTPASPE